MGYAKVVPWTLPPTAVQQHEFELGKTSLDDRLTISKTYALEL